MSTVDQEVKLVPAALIAVDNVNLGTLVGPRDGGDEDCRAVALQTRWWMHRFWRASSRFVRLPLTQITLSVYVRHRIRQLHFGNELNSDQTIARSYFSDRARSPSAVHRPLFPIAKEPRSGVDGPPCCIQYRRARNAALDIWRGVNSKCISECHGRHSPSTYSSRALSCIRSEMGMSGTRPVRMP
jgi:hypothetical protein